MNKQTQLTVEQVKKLLANVSVTFASVEYATKVPTAAAHKAVSIAKHTVANVQLFSTVNAAVAMYQRAVQKSARKMQQSVTANVDNFVVSAPSYTHDDECYSIVYNANTSNTMLYMRYIRARSTYSIDGVVATKQQVAAYLTPSAAKALLQADNTVHNVTNDVTHGVIIRTVGLHNVTRITARKQVLLA